MSGAARDHHNNAAMEIGGGEVVVDIVHDEKVMVRRMEASTSALFSESGGSKSSSSFRHNASFRLKNLLHGLKRLWLSHSWGAVRAFSCGQEIIALAAARQRHWLPKSGAGNYAVEGLRFVSKTNNVADDRNALWAAVEARFLELVSPDGKLSRADFGVCIGMKDSKEFAGELFDAIARRKGINSQSITKKDLHDFWLQIFDQSFDGRMQIFFDMCDKNADGRISEKEVKEVIMLSASANKLSKLKEQAEMYAASIMDELDPENLGYIELWQLETLLRGPVDFGRDTYSNDSQTLSQTLVPPRRINPIQAFTRAIKFFLDENWKRVWVVVLWFATMGGLFWWKFMQYRHKEDFYVMGYCVCIAKGAAETLKLNMALILLPLCRNTITWLRSTCLRNYFLFDDNIHFHKLIAVGVAIGVFVHAGLHLFCDFPRIAHSSDYKFNRYVGRGFHYHEPTYMGIIASVEGITGITMVILMIIAFTLATRRFRKNLVKLPWPLHRLTGFNAFWYSHHLFVIVYILLIIHSVFLFLAFEWYQKTTWMYLAVPVLLYGGERTLREFRSGHNTVQIVKAAIYTGNVLALHLTKPPGFKYKSGMYLFLRCPLISPFQWHPFSITSAPNDEYLSVHIRTLGDWTEELYRIFSEVCEPPMENESGLLRAECKFGDGALPSKFPKLLIDGPYGAPAQDYKKYDVLLLIGLGIGATPFISILKDILNLVKMTDEQQDSVHTNVSRPTESPQPIESSRRRQWYGPTNAYFYWLTREQGSFDWFKGVMNEVAEIDQKAMIEMHNYLTSVYEEGDARSTLITMLQALHHSKNGVDIVSGTRVNPHSSTRNW